MKPRHRMLGMAWLIGTALAVVVPGAAALAQEASTIPTAAPPLAVFRATLKATQTEHLGEVLKVIIEPPSNDPACRDGLESNSTDQTLTLV